MKRITGSKKATESKKITGSRSVGKPRGVMASAHAAALVALAAASLATGDVHANAASNMNLGYEFLDEGREATSMDEGLTVTAPGTAVDAPTRAGGADTSRTGLRFDSSSEAEIDGSGPEPAESRPGRSRAADPVGSATSDPAGNASGSAASDAAERLAAAEMLYREGRHDQALAAFRGIVQSSPGNAHAWLRIGNLLHRKRDWFDALSAYRRAARPQAEPMIREKAMFNVALLNLELARQSLKRLQRIRAEGAVDPASTTQQAGGVAGPAVQRLSSDIERSYRELSRARSSAISPAISPAGTSTSEPVAAPRPGPRTPKPLPAERAVQVETRQGGAAR